MCKGGFHMRSNRRKSLLKAARENYSQQTWKIIPDYYSFVSNTHKYKVRIVKDDYKTIEEYSSQNDNLPFIIVDEENYKWLNSFASNVVSAEPDFNIPFLNYKKDVKNPGISGFRFCATSEEKDEIEFIQVQVYKNPQNPWIYQLDYFEPNAEEKMIKKLVGLCDVSATDTIYDLVYKSSESSHNEALEMLGKVVCLFRSILIYMRIWDYDMDNISKTINIAPFNVYRT